ncbi:MAG: ERCC4 domain-containing protein [Desulfovibrionaceae bacterium]|nr:ERCC4 domain-containing protein [Desulfovibrionaceae bacterium]
MRVIIDSREQSPFAFHNEKYGVEKAVGTLSIGDYSLAGLEDHIAVERKSLPDLVLCLGRERDRFERELQRGAALDAFCVVCEGS